MDRLQALNLKEVKVTNDVIPVAAMYHKYSLARLVLPDRLKEIKSAAFSDCRNLTGSLIIPEGVTKIEGEAFYGCKNFTGSLSLP